MYAAGTSPQYAAAHPDTLGPVNKSVDSIQKIQKPAWNENEPWGWKYPSNVPQRQPQGSAFPPAPAAPAAPQPQGGDDVSSWLSTLQPEDMSFLRQLIAAVREAQGRDAKQTQQPQAPVTPPSTSNAPVLRQNPGAEMAKRPGQWLY